MATPVSAAQAPPAAPPPLEDDSASEEEDAAEVVAEHVEGEGEAEKPKADPEVQRAADRAVDKVRAQNDGAQSITTEAMEAAGY